MNAEPKNGPLNVLVVDDDPDIHYLVKEHLKERPDLFSVVAVDSLKASYEAIQKTSPDVVLLDLSLTTGPSSLESFDQFRAHAAEFPVVIFTSLDDESAALEAVKKGAQDYLVKGHITPRMLMQVLRYAVERFRKQEKAGNPQVIDAVTGLSNEQGFSVVARQLLPSLNRNLNGTLIFLFVVDGLDEIESKFGSSEVNRTLKTSAEILKESFRASDLLARMGRDRFVAVPATAGSFLSRTVMSRIKTSQTYYNTRFNLYKILIRWQVLHFPPDAALTVEQLQSRISEAFSRYKINKPAVSSDAEKFEALET